MSQKPAHTIISIIMNILVLFAIALTARVVVEFFGQLAAQQWGKVIILITDPLVIPFGVDAIKTPYGGVLDVDASIMIGLLLCVEWLLSTIRSRS